MEDFYPQGPKAVSNDLTRPNRDYRIRAWLAGFSLVLFVALYLALAGWFVFTAYTMGTEALAGGDLVVMQWLIAGAAAFLAVFMLKALFFVRKGGAPDALEVTPEQQPRLFDFLYRLADEAGAPRPKRVFLSGRVNAAVFYDLSVLNLLFPSRKNLEIGLALVNVLTLSEFKAVLAHEFGHFAQRSMAIGSWVYIAQQIAGHVIAKRDALDKFLQFLSRIDLRIAWVGWLLSLVVWSIRSLLDSMLRVVVLAQRALSRQMEFQADLVSVSLTGSDELVHALHKLQAADDAWDRALAFGSEEIGQGRLPHDLFAVQSRIIGKVAGVLGDESYGKVPRAKDIDPAEHRVFSRGFAQPPQMWSTHPGNADREGNAKRIYISAPHDDRSAWLLFEGVDKVKDEVVKQMLNDGVKAQPTDAETTFEALDKHYRHVPFESRFRSTYLGRALTRYAASPTDLYDEPGSHTDIREALQDLYPPELATDMAHLRELEEERLALQALQDKVYQATGGTIVFRGREISRRDLPVAIRDVLEEETTARERILAHDRRCRGLHLAAAERLGQGGKPYLLGLISVLHYAEHSLADLRDASGLLSNVLAVVTADGRVSARERERLVTCARELYRLLEKVFVDAQFVHLDERLCARLDLENWAAGMESFNLPLPDHRNLGDWMGVIDGWVNSITARLSSLISVTLEQLLIAEDDVAQHLRDGTQPAPWPTPSRIETKYGTLLPGSERKRQRRLGLWDRFQTADGLLPATARLLAAVVIVGGVLGFSWFAGGTDKLSIYNGLGVPVQVHLGSHRVKVAPFSATDTEVTAGDDLQITTETANGRPIEHFKADLHQYGRHFVYNVAGASPLVQWTAVYGRAQKQPPELLGDPRWLIDSADYFFTEPPRSVKASGGGATRSVLTGLGDRAPSDLLKLVRSDAERQRIIQVHAKWDTDSTPYALQWRQMGAATGQ